MILDRGSMAKSSITASSSEWACRYVSLHRDLRDAREHGRANVLAMDVKLADPLVHALGQPLLKVRDDSRILPPRTHVIAGAIRAEDGDDALGSALVELEGAVVRRAGHEGTSDPRLIEDGKDLLRRVRIPVGPTVVDVAVEERRLRAAGGGAEGEKGQDEQEDSSH